MKPYEINCVIKILPLAISVLFVSFYYAKKTVDLMIKAIEERPDCIYWNYSETDGVKTMKPSAWKIDPIEKKHLKLFGNLLNKTK